MLPELFLHCDAACVQDVDGVPSVSLLKKIGTWRHARWDGAIQEKTEGVQSQAAKGGDAPQYAGVSIHGTGVYHPDDRNVMIGA